VQALKKYRKKSKGVADLLDWAALIDDGVVLNKSGSLLAGYFYRGQDIASSTVFERNYITGRVNVALAKFGNGWATWHDAVRMPAASYPSREQSHFPDPISLMIDEERRTQFLSEGAHFETEYVLIFCFTPPQNSQSKLQDMMWDEDKSGSKKSSGQAYKKQRANKILENFNRALSEVEDSLSGVLKMRRMSSYLTTDDQGASHLQDELVSYLHFCLTGNAMPINIPPHGMYLDAYLGGQELWVGDTPKIGHQYVCCVAIEGFPHESYPNILDILEGLPIAYRWSTRMIYLDQHTALNELKKYRRQWKQKVRGFWSQLFKTTGGVINEDALMMANEAEAAISDVHSSLVTFGYYTPVVVLMSEDREGMLENARLVKREVERIGFVSRIETVNAMEAWLGSLPGHAIPNIRRPLIHTLNQADLIPLSSMWAGASENPCDFYLPHSPPLAHTATSGSTPFRLNLHVGDVGHTLILGPTGAGKSTLLCFIEAQFRRYQGATICAFDKGRSMLAVVKGCGGQHYDVGADTILGHKPMAFAPLASLERDSDVSWAEDWIDTCYELQAGKPATPKQREEVHRALRLLRSAQEGGRSLTDFILTVQDSELRSALSHYTIDGSLGHLLDGVEDSLTDNAFVVFEMEEIMAMGEKNLIPVLLYLFRRFEKTLKGQPALLVLDEAWVMLGHPVFREKIREWLKVLRKANCAVVMATQSLSDAVKSGIFDVLIESCPTKIFLPNEEADKSGTAEYPGPRDLYAMMGLNDAQITILKNATKKRHYYYTSPEGRRLFDLGLGPMALSFVGVSGKEEVAKVKQLVGTHEEEWTSLWLEERGVIHES
jgi:type IV secretion system protein VirB4